MNLKKARKHKKLTQKQLAENIGVSVQTIRNLEAHIDAPNKREPKISIALALKTILPKLDLKSLRVSKK
jgi:DNA-binding XRE family transcriptional regulator